MAAVEGAAPDGTSSPPLHAGIRPPGGEKVNIAWAAG